MHGFVQVTPVQHRWMVATLVEARTKFGWDKLDIDLGVDVPIAVLGCIVRNCSLCDVVLGVDDVPGYPVRLADLRVSNHDDSSFLKLRSEVKAKSPPEGRAMLRRR